MFLLSLASKYGRWRKACGATLRPSLSSSSGLDFERRHVRLRTKTKRRTRRKMLATKTPIPITSSRPMFQDVETKSLRTSERSSQWVPLKPAEQLHLKEPYVFWQWPPLEQGFFRHSSTSLRHLFGDTNIDVRGLYEKYLHLFDWVSQVHYMDGRTYLSPWKPGSHSHTGPSRLSMHLPLFLHGLSVQYGPNWHLRWKTNVSVKKLQTKYCDWVVYNAMEIWQIENRFCLESGVQSHHLLQFLIKFLIK